MSYIILFIVWSAAVFVAGYLVGTKNPLNKVVNRTAESVDEILKKKMAP